MARSAPSSASSASSAWQKSSTRGFMTLRPSLPPSLPPVARPGRTGDRFGWVGRSGRCDWCNWNFRTSSSFPSRRYCRSSLVHHCITSVYLKPRLWWTGLNLCLHHAFKSCYRHPLGPPSVVTPTPPSVRTDLWTSERVINCDRGREGYVAESRVSLTLSICSKTDKMFPP